MPEGHTVHRLAQAFAACFVGRQVQASSPQGRFAQGAAGLDGRVLLAAEAHGKQMFLAFSGGEWLRVHLGLYGMWRFFGEGLEGFGRRGRGRLREQEVCEEFPPAPRGAVRLRLVAGLHVADLSGPTACEVLSGAEVMVAKARLGEDPLRADADPARAFAKVRVSRTSVALLLMRQDIVAGIGNIYRAELLFRARLEPHGPGRGISAAVWDALWADMAGLLADGVRTGRIVTVEQGGPGPGGGRGLGKGGRGLGKGRRGPANYVAHRAGKPCLVCGAPVLREALGGRALYWCSVCQVQ